MPHTPDTHLTITPKHVYINGKPISVAKDALELSNPSPAEVQTATLTIHPTTVTILNDDDPNTAKAAYEAHTRREIDESGSSHSTYIYTNDIADPLDAWKRGEAVRESITRTTR